MKSILCFGDSNTFGDHPITGGRYPRDQRWTGVLQKILGDEYYIIEDGLSGRTTVWEDPMQPHRRGLEALPVSLLTHRPLDLVIISLGTNDLKNSYCATPIVISESVEVLVEAIKNMPYGKEYKDAIPKILIISPIYVGDNLDECPFSRYDEVAREKSYQLSGFYQAVAERNDCYFLDAAKYCVPGADQLHMDEESHKKLAEVLAVQLQEIFAEK